MASGHRQVRGRNGFIIIFTRIVSAHVIRITIQIKSRVTVWLNESPLRFYHFQCLSIGNAGWLYSKCIQISVYDLWQWMRLVFRRMYSINCNKIGCAMQSRPIIINNDCARCYGNKQFPIIEDWRSISRCLASKHRWESNKCSAKWCLITGSIHHSQLEC